MAIANIQAQMEALTSLISHFTEKVKMQSVTTCDVPFGQGYQLHQRPQFPKNRDAWGHQGYDQPSHNMFPNTYNSNWRDYSDYMWGEPQQFQQSGYWQQDEEFYSSPMQPPQPPSQQFQSNSSMSMTCDEILDVLTSLTQGSRQEEYSQPSEEFYQWPYAPSQPPPQSSQTNSGTSLANDQIVQLLTSLTQEEENQTKRMQNQAKKMDELEKQVGHIMEFMAQIQEQSEFSNSTIENSEEDFEILDDITLGSAMEVGADLKTSKHSLEVDELLLQEEEEEATPTAPKDPTPCNSGNIVPNSIHSNPIPPSVPFPIRFLVPKEEDSEKDIMEALPKVQSDIPILGTTNQVPDCVEMFKEPCTPRRRSQEKEVAGEFVECIKEDVFEETKPDKVEFHDTGQVTTIIVNLAKSNIPETFKDVVFVIEFVSEQARKPSSPTSILFATNLLILMIQAPTLEFRPLPDHFKYHRPFTDKPMHANQKGDQGIAPQSDLRS